MVSNTDYVKTNVKANYKVIAVKSRGFVKTP